MTVLSSAARPAAGPLMSDGTFRSVRAMKRELSADQGGSLLKILAGLWPYIWPSDRRDLKIRVLIAMVLLLLAKLATIAVPFTFKWAVDALTGQGTAPVAPSIMAGLGAGGADPDDDRLWRLAHPDGGADADARRHLRQGVDARGAPARLSRVRAHAPALLALPSGAQDRRSDPRARARPHRDRDDRAHGDHAGGADGHRAGADHRRAALPVRLALRRGDHPHRDRLHGVHLCRDRVAHRHPPPHERQRHRRQRQGGRTRCSTTRR